MAWALLLLAAAPPLILISGFHGNTDAVMVFFLLLSVYLTERGRSSWASGASFGLSVSIKVVPLMFVPVMFLYLGNHRKRFEFFAATGAVLLLGWSPFIFQDPWYILKQVFGYKSIYGVWGLSWVLAQLWRAALRFDLLIGVFPWLADVLSWLGRYITLGLILLLSLWMNRSGRKPSLFSQVGIIFLVFLSLSNGFGVQYLAWLAPWVVGLGAMPTAILFTASGAFLFLVYNYWAQGFPWYLADSSVGGWWQTPLDYFQVVCWLSVVVALWAAWTQMETGPGTGAVASAVSKRQGAGGKRSAVLGPENSSQRGLEPSRPLRMSVVTWPLAFALFVAALAVYPLVQEVPGLTSGFNASGAAGTDSLRNIRAKSYRSLSFHLLRLRRFQDTVTTAREAIRLDPNSADAYTYMVGAYVGLRRWDEAIENAHEALRINPDSVAAKNNLAWVLQEKLLKGGRAWR
jgi:tetratricopeptide (TPR) repeat protein